MATTALALLLLATLVALGRTTAPLTARDLPSTALHGAVVLSRLSDRRRERLRRSGGTAPGPGAAADRLPAPC